MGWQLPPLNALRAFEAAGRLSSFTLAAEELHVTPGAVSRQIKLLEETLGIPLFIRNNREVRLTPESALYLTTLTESFRRMDAATGSLRDARRDRPLRIMCSGNVATRWLFPHLRQFHTRYPNRQVLLTTSLTTASVAFNSRHDRHPDQARSGALAGRHRRPSPVRQRPDPDLQPGAAARRSAPAAGRGLEETHPALLGASPRRLAALAQDDGPAAA